MTSFLQRSRKQAERFLWRLALGDQSGPRAPSEAPSPADQRIPRVTRTRSRLRERSVAVFCEQLELWELTLCGRGNRPGATPKTDCLVNLQARSCTAQRTERDERRQDWWVDCCQRSGKKLCPHDSVQKKYRIIPFTGAITVCVVSVFSCALTRSTAGKPP